jgi:hypothetical protein
MMRFVVCDVFPITRTIKEQVMMLQYATLAIRTTYRASEFCVYDVVCFNLLQQVHAPMTYGNIRGEWHVFYLYYVQCST